MKPTTAILKRVTFVSFFNYSMVMKYKKIKKNIKIINMAKVRNFLLINLITRACIKYNEQNSLEWLFTIIKIMYIIERRINIFDAKLLVPLCRI